MPLHKCLLLLPFFLICITARAQVVSGRVVDMGTRQPIGGVLLITGAERRSTNERGEFRIKTAGAGDTIKMFTLGYKHHILPVKQTMADGNIISLQRISIVLNQVNIITRRNNKQDSINNRMAFAGAFNYKAPKLTDIMVPPPQNVPFAWVSIDLLRLISVFAKNSNPANRLQQTLLKDEQAAYTQTRYNKALINRVTQLQGDSLRIFTDKYFPGAEWVRKATDYELIRYIKDKAAAFRAK